MAPSVRGTSSRVSKRNSTLRNNAKVSKANTLHPAVQTELEELAPKSAISSKKIATPAATRTPKRKRNEIQEDSDAEKDHLRGSAAIAKKAKFQLLTPPSSQRQSPVAIELSPSLDFRQLSLYAADNVKHIQRSLPAALQDLVSLHAAFLKAFALHVVHHGQSTPANVDGLMDAVTRLWKKHTVVREDIQRILAIYELEVTTHFSGRLLDHQEGPFKLTMTSSDHVCANVEYVRWGSKRAANIQWNEYNLQQLYEAEIEALWISSRNTPTCWVHGEVRNFPKLAFAMGVQTQARKTKASAARREILGLSTQAQNRPGAQFAAQTIKDAEDADVQQPQAVKNRTLSLLDRIRAKAAASASATAATPEAVVRKYAMGRIAEVVDLLRMKQQRKLNSSFLSSVHSSPGKVRCKVSFSMNQLIGDIRDSLKVPLGEAELRMCFQILQDEIPGLWLSTYTVGAVQSVILNGPGLSGSEVKQILEKMEKSR